MSDLTPHDIPSFDIPNRPHRPNPIVPTTVDPIVHTTSNPIAQ